METMITDTDILVKARDMVAEKWWQGGYGNKQDGYCIVGAISESIPDTVEVTWGAHGRDLYITACDRLLSHLPDLGFNFPDLPAFNDAPDTTQSMVLDLFDKALSEEP